jgi:hypothetical protein
MALLDKSSSAEVENRHGCLKNQTTLLEKFGNGV